MTDRSKRSRFWGRLTTASKEWERLGADMPTPEEMRARFDGLDAAHRAAQDRALRALEEFGERESARREAHALHWKPRR